MEKEQKINLIKIIVSAALFVAGFAIDNMWLYLAAYAIVGYETIFHAFSGIIHGELLDEDFLMTVASAGAIYCGEYPEAACVMLFFAIGEFFEDYAVDNSRKSIAGLMEIKAEFANRIVDGAEIMVKPEELAIGDIIRIKPGEKVPVDGVVIKGDSSLNTAALTGESLPRGIAAGDDIVNGTVNLTGVIEVQVTKLYENSTAAKILELVEGAADRKASVEKFITKFARVYTPVVVGLAVLLAVVPPLILAGAEFNTWVYRAMIFLVISCPCALVISVPLTLFAGVGGASKKGILVKGSNYLEAMAKVNAFAFDKTGTLTHGKFAIAAVHTANGITEAELMDVAAHGECLSNHPIAVSIVDASKTAGKGDVSSYEEISGKGISCEYNGRKVLCGNDRLMDDSGIDFEEPIELGSVVYVAADGEYLGCIVVADKVRDDADEMVKGLVDMGVNRTIMLTGDKKEIADQVGTDLGLTHIYSELLPGDKVSTLEGVMEDNTGLLAFVGDGINDAPVLARADVGIAMGAFGSDAAVEAADIVIMTDDIGKLVTLKKISKKTIKICKENVVFALAVKILVMALGAVGVATMWEAVFADVGVTFIAVLNSMRAMKE